MEKYLEKKILEMLRVGFCLFVCKPTTEKNEKEEKEEKEKNN